MAKMNWARNAYQVKMSQQGTSKCFNQGFDLSSRGSQFGKRGTLRLIVKKTSITK